MQKISNTGLLSAFDFFCIVIWKANRAKSLVAKRILKFTKTDDLENAVLVLTKSVYEKTSAKEKLAFLISDVGFKLPMATAILTVLYPNEFTIYDVRVCNELKFFTLGNTANFDTIWIEYQKFKNKVEKSTPIELNLNLREKDRYLWGKSFYEQLVGDIKQSFKKEDIERAETQLW